MVRKINSRVASLIGAVLVSGCVHNVTYQAAPPQIVDRGTFGTLHKGEIDRVPYLLTLMLRTYSQDGRLGVCGLARLAAGRDVSAVIHEGLGSSKTTLTLKPETGTPIVLSPRFVRLLYLQKEVASTNGTSIATNPDIPELLFSKDKVEGSCVVTDVPWLDAYGGKMTSTLVLMHRDTRQRTQTVVGGSEGSKP